MHMVALAETHLVSVHLLCLSTLYVYSVCLHVYRVCYIYSVSTLCVYSVCLLCVSMAWLHSPGVDVTHDDKPLKTR